MQRRLAAVLAADIVGYSTLMGADEAATLAVLRAFRAETFGPSVAGRRGRIVKSMGDGWLVTFDSAVDAINTAMELQDRLSARADLSLRIGVHVGDVVQDGDDLFGDGVNVAARLEGFAAPGGIAISEPAFASLDGTLAPAFDDAGTVTLKNIARPVRVWTRAPRTSEAPAEMVTAARTRAAQGFPRIAIRPVATSDTRPEVQELAEGLTSDLDAYLGSARWLIGRVGETPAEGDYDLRCALRARGERVRLEARLFAPGGGQMWSSKVDGSLDDGFDWQDSTGEEVASAVIAALFDAETTRLDETATLTAEQCLLIGMMRFRSFAPDRFVEALSWYTAAIERDPEMMTAYAEAIFLTIAAGTVGLRSRVEQSFAALDGWVERARPHAAQNVSVGLSVAIADYFRTRQIAPLRQTVEDTLRRAPFDAQSLGLAAWAFVWSGNPEDALAALAKRRRLGRFSAYAAGAAGCEGVALVQLGRDAEALAVAQEALKTASDYPALHGISATALTYLGRQAEAEAAMANYLRLVPGRTVSAWRAENDYGGSAGGARYLEGLRRAGMPA